jgi:nitrate reductase gamma subunit
MVYMAKEIVFLKALWEHNRKLWWFSFPFHFGLYLLTGFAGLLLLGGVAALFGIHGPGLGIFRIGLPLLAGAGYLLGTAGALGLLVTRFTSEEMRNSTAPVSYINLLVLSSMFVTGLWAVLTVPAFAEQVLGFSRGLLTASLPPAVPGIVSAHFICAFVFLAYLPFTQMMHFVAKYFTYHEVRWDDEPVTPGSKLDRKLKELLAQPVSWAAPHVRADGKKTWVDIATDTGKAEETRK